MSTVSSNGTEDDSNYFSTQEITEACAVAGKDIAIELSGPSEQDEPVNQDKDVGYHAAPSQRDESLHVEPEFSGNAPTKRKRNRRADQTTWKRNINKKRRMMGEEYNSTMGLRAARKIGPPCQSKACLRSKLRHCQAFSSTVRQKIFSDFWGIEDWNSRKSMVQNLVDRVLPKQRRGVRGQVYRGDSFNYHLKIQGQRYPVCKTMFMSTIGIKERQLRGWLHARPKSSGSTFYLGRAPGANASGEAFLDMLPKLPSHYCRQSTTKLYLEPLFQTKRQLYEKYKEYCGENQNNPISWSSFHNLLETKNIALYSPKKDKCDICCSHEAGNLSEALWNAHLQRKEAGRMEKTADKNEGTKGNIHCICMDVQAVKLCPVLNASSLYYKTKLIVHNFTVYDMVSREAKCYLWDESEGETVASVFATCLLDFLPSLGNEKEIVIYSDGCTNQNRNAILSTALTDYSIRNNVVITQKYLEKGHTQMEVDSIHSCIEAKLRGRSIYLPTDYIAICESARVKPSKYKVKYMGYRDFQNFAASGLKRWTNIRPGTKARDPCVTDLRQIQYNPNGDIYFKLEHSSGWAPMPRKSTQTEAQDFPKLYSSRLKISQRKYQDLTDLLNVLPKEAHSYFVNLPH